MGVCLSASHLKYFSSEVCGVLGFFSLQLIHLKYFSSEVCGVLGFFFPPGDTPQNL